MAVVDLKSQILRQPGIEELAVFRRQYLQRYTLAELQFPDDRFLQIFSVQQWIWGFVEYAQRRLPNPSYDRLFLKALLNRIEKAVEDAESLDILDSFAELYSDLLNGPSILEPEYQGYVWVEYVAPWRLLDPSRPEDGTDLLEKPNVLSAAGCTGHRTWEAALSFARWFEDSTLVKGKRVLELGAGTGLLSHVAVQQGAKAVMATDADEATLSRLTRSVKRNKVPIICKQYIWGDDITKLDADFDVVIGADVTYDPSSIPDLCSSFTQLLSRNSKLVIWLCAVLRNEETLNDFRTACGEQLTFSPQHYPWIFRTLTHLCSARKGFSISVMREHKSLDDQTGFFYPSATAVEVMLITRPPNGRRLKTFVDPKEWQLDELRVMHDQ